ncbi:hypothetical protein H4Q26_005572 [Puccinia striiformis f. sp. tritici PST-130]|nr:hypothetical protein H4Q26_005572 [Puccinia striiformis f. sp. tritici PST-130]
MNTPGPLSIALFFIGFIIITIRFADYFPRYLKVHIVVIYLLRVEGRRRRGKMEEEEDDETGSKDLMRMMLLNRQYLANQSPRINHDNRPPFDSIANCSSVG